MAEKGASKANNRQSNRHKPRYKGYLMRSTCSPCRLVFRSPKHRLAHVESGHKSMVGVNKNKKMATYESAFLPSLIK